jgi:acetyl-CoA carboxylase biotin carboxylase subunit
MFESVLIANRGEIAVRVLRACRELGVRVIAVYSAEDRDSAVVRAADASVQIGPAPARYSYLNMAALMEAARKTGAQAIHPGYGFLSEDADFAEVCAAEGVTFIGPPPSVMRQLGDKMAARAVMREAGIPLLPGNFEPLRTVQEAQAVADGIGFPVIIKASAGGGGRGMRVVTDRGEFAAAYVQARGTAQSLFGDGRVYVERYLAGARHIEVQVLADSHGTTVHLGERDCSVQRRHQKMIEESPAPNLPEPLAARIRAAAVAGARRAGYQGAGTFEFLVSQDGGFYFLEVNCRIQVEHPVTEMVTGVDLVREQIRVAAGQPLGYGQEDVAPRGVSLECRVTTEDPQRGFLPAPGVLTEFVLPGGPFVRVDTHASPGYRVSAAYDSLLAKLIVWAPDREQALNRMRRALAEFTIAGHGVVTTVGLLSQILEEPSFRSGRHSTGLLADMQAA